MNKRAKATRAIVAKYPELFSQMYCHYADQGEEYDNSILYSMIMTNMVVPGAYWMPEDTDVEALFADIKAFEA